MVQIYQSPVRVYKYPFELVMAAYEKRFPSCKMIPVFLGSDIVSEYKSEDGSIHIIERRCKLNVEAPYILKKIIGVEFVYFIQKNTLNRRERTLKIDAYNESFANRVTIEENCLYSVHPENPDWTCFEQTASLDIKSFIGFESAIEKVAMKQYSQNIKKGKEIIEYYINELKKEGITYIPPFEPPSSSGAEGTCSNNTQGQPQVSTSSGSGPALGAVAAAGRSNSIASSGPSSPDAYSSDVNFKLESEYIARYLGNLTPFQESCLVQLKKWMAEAHQGKVPSDQTLVRFLQAQDYNLEKAREMLCQSLVWRKKHQVDRILSTYQPPTVVANFFPGGWHHHDKDGRPLYILRLGQMDVKGFIKSVGEDGLLKLTLHICEEGLKRTEQATKTRGRPISSWTCLLELEGLNMRHLWRPGVKALLRIIEIVEANYPETMGRVLITHAPRVFPILWTIVSTFINETTRSKFLFLVPPANGSLCGALEEFVEHKYIPDFLGGPSAPSIPEGGLIPKSFYLTTEDKPGNSLFDDSMYHVTSLTKGIPYEVVIPISDPGSVICWDFDVMKADIAFNVLRTNLPLPKMTSRENSAGGTASGSVEEESSGKLSPTGTSGSGASIIPKHWVSGQDYTSAEPTLVCHDGESVQGSHVAASSGSYILQWKLSPTGDHPSSAFDFSSHHHHHHNKAKIMYYYEVLKSQDYKGSMSSLQSSHSGTTCHSAGEQSANSSCPSR